MSAITAKKGFVATPSFLGAAFYKWCPNEPPLQIHLQGLRVCNTLGVTQ